MGYSEQTENRIRKATEKAKKKREEEYRLSQVVTGEDGTYLFEDLRYQAAVEVTAVLPLGFHAILPADGHIGLLINQEYSICRFYRTGSIIIPM